MGEKVKNYPKIWTHRYAEHGGFGFLLGRSFGPHGRPSLDDDGHGRPWTFHDPSPLVPAEVFERVCASARREPSADAWAVAVCDGAPELGAWLLGLLSGEREGLWREARG